MQLGRGGGVVDVFGIKTEKTKPNTIDVALGALIFTADICRTCCEDP